MSSSIDSSTFGLIGADVLYKVVFVHPDFFNIEKELVTFQVPTLSILSSV